MDRKSITATGMVATALAVAGGIMLARNATGRGNSDDAPGRTARRGRFGNYAVVGKTVTISKPPREQLFAFWRDFTNLPSFMENLERVEKISADRWRWTIRAPGDTSVDVDTEIAEEIAGELIAWRSVEGSDIDTKGRVRFRDADGGRGTQVELIVAYKPPLGRAGQLAAKLFQREPAIQSRRDLRRFKMLMETGEIANSDRRLNTEENA